MTPGRLGRLVLLLALPASLASCAAGRRGPVVGGETVIRVENNLVPPTAVTVRVQASAGGQALLGNIPPGAERTFRYEARAVTGEHRLVAETADGREIVSRSFHLGSDDEVRWSLRNEVLDVRRRS